jgi:hypothetical protein
MSARNIEGPVSAADTALTGRCQPRAGPIRSLDGDHLAVGTGDGYLSMVPDAAEESSTWHVRIAGDGSDLAAVLAGLGVPRARPVLAVVGCAGGMSPPAEGALVRLVADHLVPRILGAVGSPAPSA